MFFKVLKKLHLGKYYFSFFSKKKKGKTILSISQEQAIDFLNTKCYDVRSSSIRENKNVIEYENDLDIIIPAYNAENYICECIDSVLAQKTDYSYRIIVIDDGSKDKTFEILKRYSKNEKIKIIHQDNRGLSGARNTGLEYIKSRYVMFIDSDDLLEQDAIENLLSCAYKNKADSVEGAYEFISAKGKIKWIKSHKNGNMDAKKEYYGFAWGKIYNSKLFETIKFPEVYWYEDSVCRQILFPMQKKSYGIDKVVYKYRENKNGISHKSRTNDKAIESLWITLALYEDRKYLKLKNTQEYYDYLLKLLVLTYERTSQLGDEIQKNIFAVFAGFLNDNFKLYNTENILLKNLEYAVRNMDFGLYIFFSKCFSYNDLC